MKTTTQTRPTQPSRPRWPEARRHAPEPPAPTFRPATTIPDTPAHDFLVINPRPELTAPPPPPDDLDFFNIDFP